MRTQRPTKHGAGRAQGTEQATRGGLAALRFVEIPFGTTRDGSERKEYCEYSDGLYQQETSA